MQVRPHPSPCTSICISVDGPYLTPCLSLLWRAAAAIRRPARPTTAPRSWAWTRRPSTGRCALCVHPVRCPLLAGITNAFPNVSCSSSPLPCTYVLLFLVVRFLSVGSQQLGGGLGRGRLRAHGARGQPVQHRRASHLLHAHQVRHLKAAHEWSVGVGWGLQREVHGVSSRLTVDICIYCGYVSTPFCVYVVLAVYYGYHRPTGVTVKPSLKKYHLELHGHKRQQASGREQR